MNRFVFGLMVFTALAAGLSVIAFSISSSFNLLQPQIAVIPIEGEISLSPSSAFSTAPSAYDIVESIGAAENDPFVGGILLEINSPGGTIVASKEIVRRVRESRKPVVAFISDIGTSGAYYVASAADVVVADPDSLTGSIGVVSLSLNLEELLEKFGVRVRVLKEGEFKDMGSPFREMTLEEEELLQAILRDAYSSFRADVLSFRAERLSEAEFEGIADGRLLSGRQAKNAGLVDILGGRQRAVEEAASLAGIEGKPFLKDFSPAQRFDFFSLLSRSGFAFGLGMRQGFLSLDSVPRIS